MTVEAYTWVPAACPDCGAPTEQMSQAGRPIGRPLTCGPCARAQVDARRRIEQERAAQRAQQFPDLPHEVGTWLLKGGFADRAAVARATDAALLATNGLGPWSLAVIRAVFPAPTPERLPCLHCGGTGWQELP